MKAKKSLILFLIFLFTITAISQETIYNNFGDGHGGWDYNWGLGWTIAGDSITSQYGVEQAMDHVVHERGALIYLPPYYTTQR